MKLRVSYAKRNYKGKTYVTPLIVTSYRDEKGVARNKTILNISSLPDFVVKIIESALKIGDSDILSQFVDFTKINFTKALTVGPAYVVMQIMIQISMFSILKKYLTGTQFFIIASLVIERVVSDKARSIMGYHKMASSEPTSILLGVNEIPDRKTWYNTVGVLETFREKILIDLYKQNNRNSNLFLYDITSSYFEGVTCPIAEFGYNRDGKKGKLQIVIGVICDDRGCPVWIEVFSGSTSDQATVEGQVKNLMNKLKIKDIIFVGDRGMVTTSCLNKFEEKEWWENFHYITAVKRSEMLKMIEDDKHPLQLELFNHKEIASIKDNGIHYVLCFNAKKQEEDRGVRNKLIEKTEAKLKNIYENVKNGRYKKQEVIYKRVYTWINKWNMQKFFKVEEIAEGIFKYTKNEYLIESYENIDGCYIIKSNLPEDEFSKENLVEKYRDLQKVEQTFRTMKTTDIQIRPIRHFKSENVKGYVFICFLAYRIIWEMKHRLASLLKRDEAGECELGSFRNVWKILEKITVAKIQASKKIFYQLSNISKDEAQILDKLNIKNIEETVDLVSEKF